ncbi:hypothetical protein GQX74_008368 [Glossina fuscipes]|nr:hypothetical protein GQX74_008368 [Glossina fuscipes]
MMFVSIWECQVHKTAAAIAVPVAVDPFHCFHRLQELVSSSGGDSDVGYKSIDFINAGINLQLHLKNIFMSPRLQKDLHIFRIYINCNENFNIIRKLLTTTTSYIS